MKVILTYYRYYCKEEEECKLVQEAWNLAQDISDAGEGYPICIRVDDEPIFIGDYGNSKYGGHDEGEKILRDKYGVDLGDYHFWKPPPPPPPEPNRFETGELKLEWFKSFERQVIPVIYDWGRKVAYYPGAIIGYTLQDDSVYLNATEAVTLGQYFIQNAPIV